MKTYLEWLTNCGCKWKYRLLERTRLAYCDTLENLNRNHVIQFLTPSSNITMVKMETNSIPVRTGYFTLFRYGTFTSINPYKSTSPYKTDLTTIVYVYIHYIYESIHL